MSNVLINGRTAVHAGSSGILNTVDICKTQVGPAVVPIPYPNIAESADADAAAGSVFINGEPACHAASIFASSAGDEAGSQGGIKSGGTQGPAEFITSSPDVCIEGEPAVRMGDMMISNDGNTPPAPVMQAGAPLPPELAALATAEQEELAPYELDHASTHEVSSVTLLENTQPEAHSNQEESSNTLNSSTATKSSNDTYPEKSSNKNKLESISRTFLLNASEYMIKQAAHLPVEGVGINGTFFLKGSLNLEGRNLFISAMGYTAAKNMGKVKFHASVKIEINSKKFTSSSLQLSKEAEAWPSGDYTPIGSATLFLPPPNPEESIQIIISGGYTYSAPEGRAVPIPPIGSTTLSLDVVDTQ